MQPATKVQAKILIIIINDINACVANGGWVLKDPGTVPTTQTQVGGTLHKPALPATQPRARPPPQTLNQAPITLNSEFNGRNYWGEAPPPLNRDRRQGKY